MANVVEHIWGQAQRRPDAVALRVGDQSWTYAQLRVLVSGFAQRLESRGVQAGDRVLFVVPTGAEFVIAYHAVLAIGAVAVTVNTMSTRHELEYFFSDAGCSAVIGWHQTPGPVSEIAHEHDLPLWLLGEDDFEAGEPRDLLERADDDIAVLLYTSGTTGHPKGAVLTHHNLAVTGRIIVEAVNLSEDDRMGTALPLFHVFGQVTIMCATFTLGGSLSLLRPFTGAALLEMAVKHELTVLSGVPTMWNEMLHADTPYTAQDFTRLRVASSGGAALPLAIAEEFRERFGATVLDGYGLSETSAAATFNRTDGVRKEGSVGVALPGLDIKIVDNDRNDVEPGTVGEVAIRGPVVMREYWGRPEATRDVMHDGWFLTGDLGRMDEDGYLWIVDRAKELIIRGGYNVYPREIEEVVYSHPDVLEAAAIGIPDERLGEEIAIVIVPKPDSTIDTVAMRTWLAERLSAYKVPRVYHLVEALPRGATGKILKRGINAEEVSANGRRVTSADAAH